MKTGIYQYILAKAGSTQYIEDLYNAILSKLVLCGVSGADILELVHGDDPNKINNTLRDKG